ncbi:hypothetical protein IJJ27_01195 [bacterium]|nr:hypothetical protein [bacterium]
MTKQIIADKQELVNEQKMVVNEAVKREIEKLQKITSNIIELLEKQDGDRYIMVIDELHNAQDSLGLAYSSVKDEHYTEKMYGLDLCEYARKIAFENFTGVKIR